MVPRKNNFQRPPRAFFRMLRFVNDHILGFRRVRMSFMLRVPRCALRVSCCELRGDNQTNPKSAIPNPKSKTSVLCLLSVCCIRQVQEHLLEGGIGYIGLSLEFGGGSAGDQMPFVDNTDTLTDILGNGQCMG